MYSLWRNYENLSSELTKVADLMLQTLRSPSVEVSEVIDHLFKTEGKYLRSGLTLLSAKLGDYRSAEAVPIAAAFELLHLATLVHDDIIDNSEFRRGIPSVQSLYGQDTAVYTGDFILAKTFNLVAGKRPEFLAPLSRCTEKICLGEIRQNQNRYNSAIDPKDYFRIISGKTAALFATCSYAGSMLGSLDKKTAAALRNSAGHAGIAFQLTDDCLDFSTDFATLKKDPLADIRNGVYTLPVILCLLSEQGDALREVLCHRTLNTKEAATAASIIRNSNALARCLKLARRYTEKAHDDLQRTESLLTGNPSSAICNSLRKGTDKSENYIEITRELYRKLVER